MDFSRLFFFFTGKVWFGSIGIQLPFSFINTENKHKMKTLLIIAMAFVLGLTAQSAPITKTILSVSNNQTTSRNALFWTCTVTQTQSYTAYGTNCQGLPISATATHTCTATGATCSEAGSAASYCALQGAFNEATNYVNSQGDSCLPPEGGW